MTGKKIFEYNHREKSLEVSDIILADRVFPQKKSFLSKESKKKLPQRKKLSICLQVTHGLDVVHLMHQKTNTVITEGKAV